MNQFKPAIVAIVGRANVGKSSLLNALSGTRQAIVAAEPGTTRSSVTAKATYKDKDFWLVDTAGIKPAEDEFELSIKEQINEAAKAADVLLVVTEATVPPVTEDRQVAKLALKSKKPVVLVVNKIDKIRRFDPNDWQKLAIRPIVGVSISQKRGLEAVLEALEGHLQGARIKETSDRIRLAILGRPNVGKSSLFNAMAKKQQALVAKTSGTTRDINRIVINYHQREIEVLDTAGIRRPGKIERGVEKFSVLRALAAIEEADICLVVMDAQEPSVQLDQKIAELVKDSGKGLILVINKWDLAEKDAFTHDQLTPRIAADFAFVPWAPLIFTSAATGQNVNKLFDLTLEIDNSRKARVKTTELNKWLRKVSDSHSPAGLKNSHPKLNYMVQEDGRNLPSFRIFGAHTKLLHWSYKRYLERSFRENWPFNGTPIKFWFIEKH